MVGGCRGRRRRGRRRRGRRRRGRRRRGRRRRGRRRRGRRRCGRGYDRPTFSYPNDTRRLHSVVSPPNI